MKIVRLLMKVLALILLLTALFTNHILPVTYLIAIGAVEILFLLLVWKKKIIQIFVVIVMIISSFGLLYTENIIARLVTYDPLQTNSVSFFTLKESPILTIKSAVNKKISSSSLVEDKLTELISIQLEKQGYKQTLGTFEGMYDGVQELYDGVIDVLILDEAYIETILLIDEDFLLKTKVIWAIKNTIERVPIVSEKDVLTESFTLYIVGLSKENNNDSNHIVTINPITHSITMVAIPRDAYLPLDIATCGLKTTLTTTDDKLTHAFSKTGVNCPIGTLEKAFNIDIDYFLQVDFSSFSKIIGAIGTITVWNEEAFTEDSTTHAVPYHYDQGWIELNEENALAFARQRHGFTLGDIQRVRNQQEVIKGIINKLTELGTLTKIESIVRAVSGSIDTNMLPAEIMALARTQIQNLSFKWTISSATIKTSFATLGTLTYGYGKPLSVVILDPASMIEARKALLDNMVIPVSN
jgi:polyisoprenyl-teichoic acid--peptidoglycan teichoic acid transferase